MFLNQKIPFPMSVRFIPILTVLVSFSFFFACSNGDSTQHASAKEDGTAQMVSMLRAIADSSMLDSVPNFRNSVRAERYRQLLETTQDPYQRINHHIYYGYELLNAGQNEQAVVTLEEVRQQFDALKITDKQAVHQLKRILALAYIRIGEQENCISRYNPDRCLIPIEGEGIYEIREASYSAIALYKEILAEKPDDYESQWMLNFAYITLGEYPDKVPAKWRIPPSAFKSDYQIPRFPNIAESLGVNTVAEAGGMIADDFDNDGFIDIFASSWSLDDQIHFFRNNGDGSFSDKTVAAKLQGLTGGLNLVQTDYNNDGWLDVFVLRGAWFDKAGKIPNSLLRNNGDGTFSDVTSEAGLLSFAPTQTAVWADFDNDGWVDLFVGNESLTKESIFKCELYKNNGDGTFTNKTIEGGLGDFAAMVKGVTVGDVNDDGWLDMYLSFLTAKNYLLINRGPSADGFVTFGLHPDSEAIGEPQSSFPCWFWDYDNDGWEDIFVAGFGEGIFGGGRLRAAALAAENAHGRKAGSTPRLYRNKGDGTFENVTEKVGLWKGLFAMGCNFGDIDNDGFLDFYVGTGEPSFSGVVPNILYRNDRGKRFQDVTYAGGFGHIQKGHGIGFADFDNDGDQDIFAVMGGAFEGDVFGDALFLNPFGNEKSWVTLKLEGTRSNKAALGAWVKVTALNDQGVEKSVYRRVGSGSSFGGNSLQLEIGLDDATRIKIVEVRWPNVEHIVEIFPDVPLRSFVKLVEGSGAVENENRRSFEFQRPQ